MIERVLHGEDPHAVLEAAVLFRVPVIIGGKDTTICVRGASVAFQAQEIAQARGFKLDTRFPAFPLSRNTPESECKEIIDA